MNIIKTVVANGGVSGESPVNIHIVKEENLNRYIFYYEINKIVILPTNYCLYKTPEDAETAGYKLLSAAADWFTDIRPFTLIKKVEVSDPRNTEGWTIGLFRNESGAYGFTIYDDPSYLNSEFETIEAAENAALMKYQWYWNEEEEENKMQKETEKLEGPDIIFSVEQVGYIRSVRPTEIEWETNDLFIRKSFVGGNEIDTICKKLNEMGCEIKNKENRQYIITPPTETCFDSYKMEKASNEVFHVIHTVVGVEGDEMD